MFGVIFIATGSLLFGLAFETGLPVFELGALVAFVLGVILVAVEIEPRVRLYMASDSTLGYLKALVGALKILGVDSKAVYVPSGNNVKMVMALDAKGTTIDLAPVGEGLHSELIDELGEIQKKGFDFFSSWMPRMLVDGLGAADEVKVSREADRVRISLRRPFVRPLCVDPFVTENVCCKMGCPLAGALAQALASTSGREVKFEDCRYDPKLQVATTSLDLGRSP